MTVASAGLANRVAATFGTDLASATFLALWIAVAIAAGAFSHTSLANAGATAPAAVYFAVSITLVTLLTGSSIISQAVADVASPCPGAVALFAVPCATACGAFAGALAFGAGAASVTSRTQAGRVALGTMLSGSFTFHASLSRAVAGRAMPVSTACKAKNLYLGVSAVVVLVFCLRFGCLLLIAGVGLLFVKEILDYVAGGKAGRYSYGNNPGKQNVSYLFHDDNCLCYTPIAKICIFLSCCLQQKIKKRFGSTKFCYTFAVYY